MTNKVINFYFDLFCSANTYQRLTDAICKNHLLTTIEVDGSRVLRSITGHAIVPSEQLRYKISVPTHFHYSIDEKKIDDLWNVIMSLHAQNSFFSGSRAVLQVSNTNIKCSPCGIPQIEKKIS